MDEKVLESRTLFTHGQLTVHCDMKADKDAKPTDYGDVYSDNDRALFDAGSWQFVGMCIAISWNDVLLAKGSAWEIEHGTLAKGRADAWKWTVPAQDDAEGSPLHGIVTQILADFTGLPNAMTKALEWASVTE